jgi:AAA15 family ATPase/GTPase
MALLMQIDLTVKNYRCFPDSEPLRIAIRPGFTAFVGVNNSGKSSALKFLDVTG